MIPHDRVKRDEIMAQAIAQGESQGRTAFTPTKWPLMGNLDESKHGNLLGVGCEYDIWQLADGNYIATYNVSGPWPDASISWVLDPTPRPYHVLLALIGIDVAKDSGVSVEEVVADLSHVVENAVDQIVGEQERADETARDEGRGYRQGGL